MIRFQEDFLHMVWKYQYFDKRGLDTSDGLPLLVQKIGFHNQHEGPDFKESEVRIGGIMYYGHVEIHLRSSDWKSHQHHKDPAYNSVILHVVWDHDEVATRADGIPIPTLSLRGKIPLDVIKNYEKLWYSSRKLLCTDSLSEVPGILKFSMLEKALVERLHTKSQRVTQLLEENEQDWEETAYQWLFHSFGFKTNARPMLRLAKSLPYALVKKNAGDLLQVEALVFGQGDMIKPRLPLQEDYEKQLASEYAYLKQKYRLKSVVFGSEWKFMKVRPSNFPSFRLSQLAALLSKRPNLFSTVLYQLEDPAFFREAFSLEVSDYWRQHYDFGKPMKTKTTGKLSESVLNLLAINFVVPLWYAYGVYAGLDQWQEKCFNFLQRLPAEKNSRIGLFSEVGWPAFQAFDSQGMLGLYTDYCSKRRCLSCKIGQNLLRGNLR